MKKRFFARFALVLVVGIGLSLLTGQAQQPEIPEPPEIEGFDFERDPAAFQAVATGGVPMGVTRPRRTWWWSI